MAYKIMFTLYFNEQLSVEEKRDRWRAHAAKVKSIPEIKAYVQDYVIDSLPHEPTAPKQWDAIATVLFDDKETADKVLAGPAWQAVEDDADDGGFLDRRFVLGGVVDTESPI